MLCERKTLSCVRKKLRFCNLMNHLCDLVLAILANLVNSLNWVITILVHFPPFWLTGFILGNWVYVLAVLLILANWVLTILAHFGTF